MLWFLKILVCARALQLRYAWLATTAVHGLQTYSWLTETLRGSFTIFETLHTCSRFFEIENLFETLGCLYEYPPVKLRCFCNIFNFIFSARENHYPRCFSSVYPPELKNRDINWRKPNRYRKFIPRKGSKRLDNCMRIKALAPSLWKLIVQYTFLVRGGKKRTK